MVSNSLEEVSKVVTKAYKAIVFDFDGTLTATRAHEFTDPRIPEQLIQLLAMGISIAIITNRPIAEMEEDLVPQLAKHERFQDSFRDQIYIYTGGGSVGYNTKEGPHKSYFRHELHPKIREAFQRFFDEKGFKPPQFEITINPTEIKLRWSEKKKQNAEEAKRLADQVREWVKDNPYSVNITSGSATVTISHCDSSKATALKDFLEKRQKLADADVAKIADMGNKDGNDYELLSGPESYTVNQGDPSNPNQINISKLTGKKETDATAVLLQVIIQRIKNPPPKS